MKCPKCGRDMSMWNDDARPWRCAVCDAKKVIVLQSRDEEMSQIREEIESRLRAPAPEPGGDGDILDALILEIRKGGYLTDPLRLTHESATACRALLSRPTPTEAGLREAKALAYEMERCRGICINYKMHGGDAPRLLESINRSIDRALDKYRAALRASEARAELAERQYRELANTWIKNPDNALCTIIERHNKERSTNERPQE